MVLADRSHKVYFWSTAALAGKLGQGVVAPGAVARPRDDDATLDDLREALTRLEDVERTARRVLGGSHPTSEWIEATLQTARAVLGAREAVPK